MSFHPSVTKDKSSFSQTKMANASYDLCYMNDECVELLWDSSPNVMQGHTNRPRKSSFQTAFPSFVNRVQEKDASKFNPFAKIEHFRVTEPKLNNFPLSGPSTSIVKINVQDDDFVPWINYPIEESLHGDYCSGFLNDYSGFNMNPIHSQSTLDQSVFRMNSHNVEQEHEASETNRIRASPLFQLTPLFPSEVPVTKSSEVEGTKESNGSGAMNSSHFYRPVAHSRTNFEGDIERFKSNKAMYPASSNLIGLSVTEGSKKSNAICEDISRIKPYSKSPERIQSSSFAASVALGRYETEKGNTEATLASSSMYSDNNARISLCDKMKHSEGEESGYQTDEDLEEKFMKLKKPATLQGKSKKRTRAAEVHNLSERRRRDRINEKMRALQELIPNCNKTDKASMLDEAIEYLKSLQLQVQIMSMASELCVSPVIIQQVQLASRTAQYSPVGIGMGMGIGLGYSMGLYDMNGSLGHSFIQVPPIQGAQGSQQMSMTGISGQGFAVKPPYQSPSASLAKIKTSAVTGTNSEHHQKQKKTFEKLENLNTDDLQIQFTKAVTNCVKNSSMKQLSDQPSLLLSEM